MKAKQFHDKYGLIIRVNKLGGMQINLDGKMDNDMIYISDSLPLLRRALAYIDKQKVKK
jgi:hypothetical protein